MSVKKYRMVEHGRPREVSDRAIRIYVDIVDIAHYLSTRL
jgi:hypothetical protein